MILKHKTKAIFLGLLILVCFIFVPTMVSAQASLGIEYGSATGLGSRDVRAMISTIINVLLGFMGIILVGLILYGGFLWMTAGGEEDKIDKAKQTITAAIIGLVIVLAAYAIATFVVNSLTIATQDIQV